MQCMCSFVPVVRSVVSHALFQHKAEQNIQHLKERKVTMAIKIISTQATMQEYDLRNISVDLSRKTGVLIRQSRKGSDKDHYESRLRQESLVPVAIAIRGETDD